MRGVVVLALGFAMLIGSCRGRVPVDVEAGEGEGEGEGEPEGEGEGEGEGENVTAALDEVIAAVEALAAGCDGLFEDDSRFAFFHELQESETQRVVELTEATRQAVADGRAVVHVGRVADCRVSVDAAINDARCGNARQALSRCLFFAVEGTARPGESCDSPIECGRSGCGCDGRCAGSGECENNAQCGPGRGCDRNNRCVPIVADADADCDDGQLCPDGTGCGTTGRHLCRPLGQAVCLSGACAAPFSCSGLRCELEGGAGASCSDINHPCQRPLRCEQDANLNPNCAPPPKELFQACVTDAECASSRCQDGLCRRIDALCTDDSTCPRPEVCGPLNVCRAPLAPGSVCGFDDVCASTGSEKNSCYDGICRQGGEGEFCFAPHLNMCEIGLRCDPRQRICVPPAAVGEPCEDDEVCGETDAACIDGRCAALLQAGEQCFFLNGPACAAGLSCAVDNTCRPLGADGESCLRGCQAGLGCVADVCRLLPLPEQSPCERHEQCLSGFCNETCQPVSVVPAGAECNLLDGTVCGPDAQCVYSTIRGKSRCVYHQNYPCARDDECDGICETTCQPSVTSALPGPGDRCDVDVAAFACVDGILVDRVVVDDGACDATHLCRDPFRRACVAGICVDRVAVGAACDDAVPCAGDASCAGGVCPEACVDTCCDG